MMTQEKHGGAERIETKLSAARTWLIIDKPFLGALVLRLPLVEADPKWCRTTATDARALYYNRDYVDQLSLEEAKFVLAHEALHCALSHFNRRQHRVKHRWDIACDYAINPLLAEEGLTPPPGTLLMDGFKNMTAEEIYPYIQDNTDEETLDQHLYDQGERKEDPGGGRGAKGGGSGEGDDGQGENHGEGHGGGNGGSGNGGGSSTPKTQAGAGAPPPSPLGPAERETLSVQWRQRLAGAAQQAMRVGKLGGSLARLVDHLLQPQLPWRTLLARYVTYAAHSDYSFSRPSRREGDAILPSLRNAQVDVVVVLDTSGSIDDDEMREFLGEVGAIKGQLNARITLHGCDAELAKDGPWIYEPWEELTLPRRLHGGGGTRFTPAFAWAQQLDRQPDLLLYFTDAEGEFPEREPQFPVIWLVKGRAKVPWGQRIQLN